jgi:hypothetical protein
MFTSFATSVFVLSTVEVQPAVLANYSQAQNLTVSFPACQLDLLLGS